MVEVNTLENCTSFKLSEALECFKLGVNGAVLVGNKMYFKVGEVRRNKNETWSLDHAIESGSAILRLKRIGVSMFALVLEGQVKQNSIATMNVDPAILFHSGFTAWLANVGETL